jgi:hypothetical protein
MIVNIPVSQRLPITASVPQAPLLLDEKAVDTKWKLGSLPPGLVYCTLIDLWYLGECWKQFETRLLQDSS